MWLLHEGDLKLLELALLVSVCTDYGDKKNIRMCQTGCRFTKPKSNLNSQQWKRKTIITVSWYSPVPFLLCSNVEWLQLLGSDLHLEAHTMLRPLVSWRKKKNQKKWALFLTQMLLHLVSYYVEELKPPILYLQAWAPTSLWTVQNLLWPWWKTLGVKACQCDASHMHPYWLQNRCTVPGLGISSRRHWQAVLSPEGGH